MEETSRVIELLALALVARDDTTADRVRRLRWYAVEVGKNLGLSEPELNALSTAALLRDIGKLAVPEHIQWKAGDLTQEEFETLKAHPEVGAEILEQIPFPYPVAPLVRAHHERWDGSGYPDGLAGEAIPLGARILAAVESLDLDYICAGAGTRYDPAVVEALRRCWREPAAGNGEPEPSVVCIASARQETQLLFELVQELGNSLNLSETLALTAKRLNLLIPHWSLAVYVLRGDRLRAEYVSGEDLAIFSALEVTLGQGVAGRVALDREPVLNADPSLDAPLTSMRSGLLLPLTGPNGSLAVLGIYHAEPEAFTRKHLRILQKIGPKLAVAIENALRFRQAEQSVSTDYETGLPNAKALFPHMDAEVARCSRLDLPLVLLVCDAGGGSRALPSIAAKLKECCREYDYLAKVDGNRFVLVLPGLGAEQLPRMVDRLTAIVNAASRGVSLRTGHAVFPEDGRDADRLLTEADKRLFNAKVVVT